MTNPDEKTNVLVVDDLPEKLLVYRTILDELGLHLITATSGEEALRAVLQHDFAVVLLDVNMPRMNGLETASLIRKRKRSAHTPIIFLTAFADEVRVAEGYAQGAVDYITTPVIPAVLRAKVRVFADLHRMTQQVRKQAEERIALAEERTRREAAEETNRWLDFLTRAGGVLWQSLDQQVTTRSVLRLTIPYLADSAVLVTLPSDRRSPRCLSARNTADGPAIDEVNCSSLPRELTEAINKVVATGNPALDSPLTIALPLQARGQTFAVLGLSHVESEKRYSAAELTVAETFASRAASALENARLYREVQDADRQKNEFLSMLAHELRNPLAPIRNANEVLRHKPNDTDKIRWAQGVIERQLTHLVRLVDDLLDVSRLTLGKIRLSVEPVALGRVVAHAVEATQPIIDQFSHKLEVVVPREPVQVHGDEARLTQVLINLLNNAAKYTEPGGRIFVTVGIENGLAAIRVRDTGIGIAPELLPSVFDLFTQASRSLDRSQGGLGVGLTLVRQLVEMHGGSVEAFSEGSGQGSEFVVRIPLLVEERSPPAPEANGNHGGRDRPRQLRVVVVDDNVDGAESLADLLGLLGHQVKVAHDGPGAMELIGMFRPEVVLLDIGLPGMDGYEVARRLRSGDRPVPLLVAVSGYGREEDLQHAREAGFEHHFVKPVQFESIRTLLDNLMAAPCA
jgi:signal transduction histidine kinase/DNA-binding response OmpR family regulator